MLPFGLLNNNLTACTDLPTSVYVTLRQTTELFTYLLTHSVTRSHLA